MTPSRLAYLDEQRWRLYAAQRGRCAHCGRVYRREDVYRMQMAHRLHRVGLGRGVPSGFSSYMPNGHSSVHRLH